MASMVPLLLLAGGAVLLAGKKKKTRPSVAPPEAAARGTGEIGGLVVENTSLEAPLFPFENVKAVQEALLVAGYELPNYGADGQWGPESEAAMAKFMADRGRKYGTKGRRRYGTSRVAGLDLLDLADEAAKAAGVSFPYTARFDGPYCDISADPYSAMGCGQYYECIPLHAWGEAPAGQEDLGFCVPRSVIFDGIPALDVKDYGAGGYTAIIVPPYGYLDPKWPDLAIQFRDCWLQHPYTEPRSKSEEWNRCLKEYNIAKSIMDKVYIGTGFFMNKLYPWLRRRGVSASDLSDPKKIENITLSFMKQTKIKYPGRGWLQGDMHYMNEIEPGNPIEDSYPGVPPFVDMDLDFRENTG